MRFDLKTPRASPAARFACDQARGRSPAGCGGPHVCCPASLKTPRASPAARFACDQARGRSPAGCGGPHVCCPASLLWAILATFISACSSGSTLDGGSIGPPVDSGTDAGNGGRDGMAADNGTGGAQDATFDGGVPSDTGTMGSMDSGPGTDAMGPPDTGVNMMPELAPGSHVTLTSARIDLVDTFMDVMNKLGAGTRTNVMGARSYEWTLGGVHLTVWFANTMLSSDAFPNDIHPNDKVLWIAVDGAAYTGKTPNGIGIGSNKTMVEAPSPQGYGPSPRAVPITTGGSLSLYYTTGFLVAYDQNGAITTFTVCKAYKQAPDGALIGINQQGADMSVQFAGGTVKGTILAVLGGQTGTSFANVQTLLGTPDGEGMVTLGGQQLNLLSYGFIGLEFFASPQVSDTTTLFISVHAPYYGALQGSQAGIGSTRTDIEAAIGSAQAMPSQNQPGLVCYNYGSARMIGVTYTNDNPPVASTITLALPQCP